MRDRITRTKKGKVRWRCCAPVVAATLFMADVPAAAPPGAEALALPAFAVAAVPVPLPAAVRGLPADWPLAPQDTARPASPSGSAAGALGDASLAELRGGTETPWSDMRLGGTVGGNSASHVVTGANHITDGAFSNASGLPMVIQNSGANVLIQNATIVNVQFR
ncbi:hypothetical protein OU994_14765 [Pseudoduganella sp. SL102]|uniref:hypothetical protein n=1 Tax=Pseudoduganella sp. SL102 TaxID=2995154 RepID=UPI00248AC92C|nr:hypothetical protein [Pseudoduganella sp. SL102]WBS05445.1 hypothetical protein OU994_14765 [Pseudoduganella sp. SL102]